jgi:hypothetical protein
MTLSLLRHLLLVMQDLVYRIRLLLKGPPSSDNICRVIHVVVVLDEVQELVRQFYKPSQIDNKRASSRELFTF